MEPITVAVILGQIAVSLITQAENRETAEAIKEEQRLAKKKEILDGQKRDMERFLRSCELQEQMELNAHKHKIKTIRQGFMNSFEKMIHKDNLEKHYRLNVSPYIIQRSVIPQTDADIDNVRHELFCILTGSNDTRFNSEVLPYIDERISNIISQLWNETSNHTVCYYQNMWDLNSNPFSEEDIENLHVLIPTPTATVTPLFSTSENRIKLTLLVNVWGTNIDNTITKLEIDPGISFQQLPKTYSPSEIESITDKVALYTICAVGQIADIFYWTNFYQAPLLPTLMGEGILEVPATLKKQYADIYSHIYRQVVLGSLPDESGDPESRQLAKDIVEINQYNHPERSIFFLKHMFDLPEVQEYSSGLILDSMLTFYRVKTDLEATAIEDVNAAMIKNEDVAFLSQLIEQSKLCKANNATKQLIKILHCKIIS